MTACRAQSPTVRKPAMYVPEQKAVVEAAACARVLYQGLCERRSDGGCRLEALGEWHRLVEIEGSRRGLN